MTMHPDRLLLLLLLNETVLNTHRLDSIMTSQENLNTDVTALTDGIAAIEAEVAALKSQPAAAQLDLSGLDAVVKRVRGDVPAAPAQSPAPAEPTPPAPAAPAAPASPAAPATPAQPAAPHKTLYTFDGDLSTVDHTEWPAAGTSADGKALYTFAGDTAPGDVKGSSGPWHQYAAPSASATTSGPAVGDSIPAPGAPSAAAPAEAAPAATTPSGLTPPATGATPA